MTERGDGPSAGRGQADSQPQTSAFIQDSGLSVHKKHALSKRPPSTLPQSVLHTTHPCTHEGACMQHTSHLFSVFTVCAHEAVTAAARLPETTNPTVEVKIPCCRFCSHGCRLYRFHHQLLKSDLTLKKRTSHPDT